MKKIKLGMIGLSEGNGHPYSWSAIINGYDAKAMEHCPFPVIPQYLAKQEFPEASIQHAEVTQIWTQDTNLSHHIANATFIPTVVSEMEQMIPEIDGVLLARDDAENHLAMAKPFLQAGLPIYIDKPIALSCREVDELYALQQYPGQIFTCSAFQYARELITTENINTRNLSRVEAVIKNDWNKYAIHLIEPILRIIGHHHDIEQVTVKKSGRDKSAVYFLSNGVTVDIQTFKDTDVKPSIHFMHDTNRTTIIFEDTFYAFKAALEKFIVGVQTRAEMTQQAFVKKCIEMLEKANTATV